MTGQTESEGYGRGRVRWTVIVRFDGLYGSREGGVNLGSSER